MTGKRADTLLELMYKIEHFTLARAWKDLTDDEFFWEPFPLTWSIRRQDQCRTPDHRPKSAGPRLRLQQDALDELDNQSLRDPYAHACNSSGNSAGKTGSVVAVSSWLLHQR
jgi:hypothetical protein